MYKMNEKQKILIIEDSPVQRAVIVNVIKELGYEPIVLERFDDPIHNILDAHSVSMVLLDLILLNEDGSVMVDAFQLCTEIKEQDENIKVIVVSAEGDEVAKEFALLNGADGFMQKPFRVQELQECLRTFV